MKISIMFFLLLIISVAYPQTADTTKWNVYVDSSQHISFNYPSYFALEKSTDTTLNCRDLIYMHFEFYSPMDEDRDGDGVNDSVELPSELGISICSKEFSIIAKENDYVEKNGMWYADSNHFPPEDDYGLSSYDAGAAIYFDDWAGITAIYNTSYFLKEGGMLTAAGEDLRFILSRKISENKFLYVKGNGFNFPFGGKILVEICRSIRITEG